MAAASVPGAADVRDRLVDDVERWRAEHRIPGVALAIVGPGDAHWIAVRGVADELTGDPLRADHRFQLGSISKVVTALAVLQAVDAGAIRLDDPIVRHVPWFRAGPWADGITIHHLLCHQGGLPIGPDWSDASAFDVWALRDLDVMRPGERYWYSNVGYKTLAVLLTSVRGGSLPDLHESGVLRPLGMTDALGRVGAIDLTRDAVGHEPEPDRYPRSAARRVPAPELAATMGDGNVLASIQDAATLARGLLRLWAGDSTLVSTASAAALFGRHTRIARGRWYGYGLGIDTSGGRSRFGHGGDMPGFRSSLVADPEATVAVVVLANVRGAPTRDLARHALHLATSSRPGPPMALQLHPHPDPELAGRYRDDQGEVELRIEAGTASLVEDGFEHRLRPIEPSRFEVLDASAGRHHLAVRGAGRRRGATMSLGSRLWERDGGAGPSAAARRPARVAALDGSYLAHDPWSRSAALIERDRRTWLVEEDGTEHELIRVARDRYRLDREPNPERLVADAWVDGHPQRLTVSGRPMVREA